MKKTILFLVSILILTACSPAQSDEAEANIKPDNVAAIDSKEELRAKKDGVEVIIKEIKRADNKTVIILAMDNHIYDLSGMDVQSLSSLNGIRPVSYQIENTLMGGHHVDATMTFPEELSGMLTIGLNTDLVFNFDLS